MSDQLTYIAHPANAEQVKALRAFMLALNIDFEISGSDGYKDDFVAKVLESRAQADQGQSVRVSKENFEEFLGL